MLRLKSRLVIEQMSSDGKPWYLVTQFRVFDLRSLAVAYSAVASGSFGMYSRRKFFLVGDYLSADGWVSFQKPLLMRFGRHWGSNPLLVLFVTGISGTEKGHGELISRLNQWVEKKRFNSPPTGSRF